MEREQRCVCLSTQILAKELLKRNVRGLTVKKIQRPAFGPLKFHLTTMYLVLNKPQPCLRSKQNKKKTARIYFGCALDTRFSFRNGKKKKKFILCFLAKLFVFPA